MSPYQQRKAIAEADGWKRVEVYEDNAGPPILVGLPPAHYERRHSHDTHVPDYLGDVNQMRAVAMRLDLVSRRVFVETLIAVCDDTMPGDPLGDAFALLVAGAPRWAEAFLRTIGKWEGEER